jgi:hypothetical protein
LNGAKGGPPDCRGNELLKEQHGQQGPLPINKVRLATSVEKAAYEAADQDVELYREIKIVSLVDAIEHAEAGENALTDNQADETAAERKDAHYDDKGNSTFEAASSTNAGGCGH